MATRNTSNRSNSSSARSPGNSTAGRQNAKMVGGGFQPGTTDFGPSTSATHGGRGAAGTKTNRTGAGGNDTGNPGMTGANGNSVTATGRRTRADDPDRGTIGGEALPTRGRRRAGGTQRQDVAGTSRAAAGTTSAGTLGGGRMGTGATGNRDRSADITDPARAGGPEGALAADVSPGNVRRRTIGPAQDQVDEDADDAWRRAGGAKSKAASTSRGRNKNKNER
jgi:hypothetical protein